MIEMTLLTLITLTVLVLLRPGKTPVLESPLLISRPGHYEMALAPQLNLAQPFIEAIAETLGRSVSGESATLGFAVQDKNLIAPGRERYFLAITQRNGLLYFQAIFCALTETKGCAETLQTFANQTLQNIQPSAETDANLNQNIQLAVESTAKKLGISISSL